MIVVGQQVYFTFDEKILPLWSLQIPKERPMCEGHTAALAPETARWMLGHRHISSLGWGRDWNLGLCFTWIMLTGGWDYSSD